MFPPCLKKLTSEDWPAFFKLAPSLCRCFYCLHISPQRTSNIFSQALLVSFSQHQLTNYRHSPVKRPLQNYIGAGGQPLSLQTGRVPCRADCGQHLHAANSTRDGGGSPYERGVSVSLPRQKCDLPLPRAPCFIPEQSCPSPTPLRPVVRLCRMRSSTTTRLHERQQTCRHTPRKTTTAVRRGCDLSRGRGQPPLVALATMKTFMKMHHRRPDSTNKNNKIK